ncbi:kinase-like protein [Massarina eburnea CBS 473.64]|uniref:non-specific serine/threonine protein kinase n=1 Tax=Massarina eburnea CBS 473.64 TaxID=1395130 RepID=A0A6A6S452_9PLEO|nr:kinase-like protein [Massarina eburnea CBS 473.64]
MSEKQRRYSDSWWKEIRTKPERKWVTVKELGINAGGMNGGIAIVKDLKTGKEFVEKRAKQSDIKTGFTENEILILKFLSCPGHPHINPLVDHFVDKKKERACIYLEYCSLGGLNSYINNRRGENDPPELFNEIDVWEWFIQLMSALAYCHYGPDLEKRDKKWNTTWHRDLKTPNILVTERQPEGQTTSITLQIADFGCSMQKTAVWERTDKKRDVCSFQTPQWAPPEVVKKQNYTTRSDIGAVIGCICNLVNFPSQFDHSNPAPGYTHELNEAIRGCMIVDQNKRPKSYEVLLYVKDKYNSVQEHLNTVGSPNPAFLSNSNRPPNQPNNYQPSRAIPGMGVPMGGMGGMGGRFGGMGGGRGQGFRTPGSPGIGNRYGGNPVSSQMPGMMGMGTPNTNLRPRDARRMAMLQQNLGGRPPFLSRGRGVLGLQRNFTEPPERYGGPPPGSGFGRPGFPRGFPGSRRGFRYG